MELAEHRRANNPMLLDLSKYNAICSRMFLLSFSSSAEVNSFANEVQKELLENGFDLQSLEGQEPNSGWILLDYGEIFLQIMTDTERQFYKLEELWR